jgi:hypothetical protein
MDDSQWECNPNVYGVAAVSATDVWAVGYNYNGPLILHYSDLCALGDGGNQ